MAAPTPLARETPGGIMLDDGYQTLITLTVDPDISFWEKTVTPPGWDGGDPIETSTMHNTEVRTFSLRSLKTLTPVTLTAAYDPVALDQIRAVVNVETTVTVTHPDGSTIAFYGGLTKADPSDCAEGAQPEITITIQPTNYDPVNHVEALPVVNEVAGT